MSPSSRPKLPKPILLIAIDPGLFGAAVLVSIHPRWKILGSAAWDFRKATGTKRRDISRKIHAALRLLAAAIPPGTSVVVEDTGSMPEQGVSSTHNFGMSRASAETVFLAAGCQLVPVSPNLWKRQMGLSSHKPLSLVLAAPWLGRPLKRIDTNLAEATLLAVWYAFRLAHLRLAPQEKARFGLMS